MENASRMVAYCEEADKNMAVYVCVTCISIEPSIDVRQAALETPDPFQIPGLLSLCLHIDRPTEAKA
jgi:hypothetical protein